MTFEDARTQFNSAWNGISKMEVRSLTLFSEAHGIQLVPLPHNNIKAAQRYVAYKYLEKICALNALKMPPKWIDKVSKACREISAEDTPKKSKAKDGRGGRAALIKTMLAQKKSREEIKIEVAGRYPGIPMSRIGCQIAATICFLKKREAQYEG